MKELLLRITTETLGTETINSATAVAAVAQEAASEGATALFTANNIWMMLATALVFIMHLGFAGVEAGFGQAKNTVNILFKNTITPIIGLVTYCFCGFNLMYPGEFNIIGDGILGFAGFGIGYDAATSGASIGYASAGYTYWTDFLFQGMFAATAATIVSGAIAERVKLSAYMVFTVIYVGLVYPFLGSWKWGAGWLDAMNFYDFAGSTLVHSVGGWGALAGIIVIGPRLGKYVDGKVIDKPGTSVPLAVIGVFLLWLGWFGFNGGSVLSADPDLVSYVLVTTCLAACTGGLFGFFTAYVQFKRMDLGMVLNGILAGLVGITAGADVVSINEALLIGAVAGILVVISAVTLDKFKLDDVVGAVSVHLTCGIWGTLAVGLFSSNADHTFMTQLIGVLSYGAVAFPIAFLLFFVLKKTIGVRVSELHEAEGLDSHEHGIRGYTIVYDN
ncbi:MAG: ammonium transporter [Cyclobacteriaceae bacterium]